MNTKYNPLGSGLAITHTAATQDNRMYDAHVVYKYTMKEIADYLGVHYATVSRAVKRAETAMHDCKT